MYQPPGYPPERKKQGFFFLLLLLVGVLFLAVWAGFHQPPATANSTFTIVTPDDSNSSSTDGIGSSTNTLYSRDTPLPTMAPTAKLHYGVNRNPWGYDFNATGGHLLYSPVPGFCAGQYFQCVSDFWERSNGYVVECRSGFYSHSGGVQGACSRNGGVHRILYSHE
jgi:hypothetical protein